MSARVGQVSSTAGMPGQVLILIGSDGVRAAVSRAVATEASYVLRDLLDGWDEPCTAPSENNPLPPSPASPQQVASARAHLEVADLFLEHDKESTSTEYGEAAVGSTNIMDSLFPRQPQLSSSHAQQQQQQQQQPSLLSSSAAAGVSQLDYLFGSVPSALPAAVEPATSRPPLHPLSLASASPAPGTGDVVEPITGQDSVSRGDHHGSYSGATTGQRADPPPIELPFPYFTGAILQLVCRHMSYRFRVSSFGVGEDGCARVYAVKTREIPRPMVMPLVEYLDTQDRRFVQDWDELTTVLVVKVAMLLNYEELLTLASAKLATFLLERGVEGLRTLLGVEGDFSPAEEAELRKEMQGDGWR